MQAIYKKEKEDEEREELLGIAGLGLVIASPRGVTLAVLSDDLVSVEANGLGDSLASLVSVLSDNVDGLRHDGVNSGLNSLVVENNGVLRSLEVPVQVETGLDTIAVGIPSVHVPSDNNQTPPVIEVLDLFRRNVAVRSTKAGRDDTQDLPKRIFDELHLLVKLVVVKLADIGVVPGVRADLVTRLVSLTDLLDLGLIIDAAEVVAIDKEGRFLVAGVSKSADELILPGVGTIVKSDREALGRVAASDKTVDLSTALGKGLAGRPGVAVIEGIFRFGKGGEFTTDVLRDVGRDPTHGGWRGGGRGEHDRAKDGAGSKEGSETHLEKAVYR